MQDYIRVSQVLARWIRLRQSGRQITDFFENLGYRKIAVYGYTDIARCLIYELSESNIKIEYIIDRQGKNLPINMPSCLLEEADANGIDAVVCCYLDDGSTVREIKASMNCEVVTVEEVLYEL